MQQRLVTVDSFYDSPYDVRKKALSLEYQDRFSSEIYISKEALEKFSYLAQQNVEPIMEFPSGKFQISMESHQSDQISANPIADWIAIIYLTLPAQLEGHQCLSFYTHSKTQAERIPTELEQHLQGWTTAEEMFEGFVLIDGKNPSAWTSWFTGFARYNRCIMFDAKLWHSQLKGFGDTINNCRLSQLFFLRNR